MSQKEPRPIVESPVVESPENVPVSFLLSLIIPCYNESARVDAMLQGLAEFEERWTNPYEVIIVDDGSTDGTPQKIREAVNTNYTFLKKKLHIEVLPVNSGKGSALKKGVSLAKGDYILTLDADMSTRPAELVNWQKREKDIFTTDNTIYIGSRRHKEGTVEALMSRKIIGSVFSSIVQIFTSLQLKDTQCGFKLYPRKVAKSLFGHMRSKGWTHDVELLHQANVNGIHIKEMPVTWINMPESKVRIVRDSVKMFFGVLSIALRTWIFNSFILPFKIPAGTTPEQKKYIINRSLFNVLAVLLLIVMPLLSFQFAVTGDEHWHFDYGNTIYKYFFYGNTEAQTTESGIQYYGGIFDFLTGFIYNVFQPWDHYTTMHFVNAIVGAIGIIYAGKLARLLTGYRTGILTMILLVMSPSWFGHNFANPKDIPFSVGYTAAMYYTILFLQALPEPGAKPIFGLFCSIGWAMGVRIGGVMLIVYLAMFIVLYALYTRQFKAVMNLRILRHFLVITIVSYLLTIACWPYAHLNIISKPVEAFSVMSNFFMNIGLVYEGKRIMSSDIPWYYIPKYILYTAPLVVLAGAAIGAVGLIPILRKDRKLLFFSFFVIFACLFPLSYAIIKKSSLYDGWRHFLFIYPPIVIIAAIGWSALLDSRRKMLKYAVTAVIVLGLMLPAKYVMAYHPLEALYYNEIAGGLKNIYTQYETDYYMLGMKPATEWLVENEHLENKNVVVGTTCTYPVLAALYKLREKNISAEGDKVIERYSDFRQDNEYQAYKREHPGFDDNGIAVTYIRYSQLYRKDWDYCIVFSRFIDVAELTAGHWPPADVVHTVEVDGVPIAVVLKRKTHKDFEGFQLMDENRYSEAKEKFLQALKEYPTNRFVWADLVRLYAADGKIDSAMYAGRQSLISNPGNTELYQLMGSVFLKNEMIDSASKLFKQLEQYDVGYYHYLNAYVYATTGDGLSALVEVDASIEADPYEEQPYKLGIKIAQELNMSDKVEEYVAKAAKIFVYDETNDNGAQPPSSQ